jgi:exonuclease SbcC
VNAIVGNSGSGKSSILRAINWLVNNNPAGDDFISWGGDCVVSISEDDWEVSRIKGKGKNQYTLKRNGKIQVYEGFGREVPEPIKKLLNMQDFNLRFQYQKPFLIGESSGEVTRYLNKVARLDIIDKAMSNIDSRLRRERSQLDVEKSVVEKTDLQLLKFKDIDQIEDHVKELESLDKDIRDQTYRYNGIYDSIEEVKSIQSSQLECKKIIKIN